MGKALDLSALDDLFCQRKTFKLTDEQYKKKTGKSLPTNMQYLKFSSPLARKAKENGYRIEVEENAVIQKVLTFTKR
ncbi:MAG: hypothetical protein IJT78_02610 [Oscillospiraceae bacterium]|nr:hypothetical protein [Oscillospiraceae bacterium]